MDTHIWHTDVRYLFVPGDVKVSIIDGCSPFYTYDLENVIGSYRERHCKLTKTCIYFLFVHANLSYEQNLNLVAGVKAEFENVSTGGLSREAELPFTGVGWCIILLEHEKESS